MNVWMVIKLRFGQLLRLCLCSTGYIENVDINVMWWNWKVGLLSFLNIGPTHHFSKFEALFGKSYQHFLLNSPHIEINFKIFGFSIVISD